jgi:Predicted membrane protein (DUF2207)
MKNACLWPLLAAAFHLHAAERVLDFHSEVRIARDGSLAVTEIITVQAEGRQLRRGIARELPFEVLEVTRNGQPEPFALEDHGGVRRLRTGAPDVLLAFGLHEYRIAYRTPRWLGFSEARDELLWPVNGKAWALPIERLSAEVRFDHPVPAGDIEVDAHARLEGSRTRPYQAFVRQGSAAFRITRPLAAHEAFTITVAFPEGAVTRATRAERFDAWAKDHPAVFAALGLVLLLALWARRFSNNRGQSPILFREER